LFRRRTDEDFDPRPSTFEEEQSRDLRREYARFILKAAVAFAIAFAFICAAVWWSSRAVRFAGLRAADRGTPTWTVAGVVRDAATRAPVAWAAVADDPAGQPPFFHSDAGIDGAFELLTLAEPHRLRVTAPGYRPALVKVGRPWFAWRPSGSERVSVELVREEGPSAR
jgi:hypothetical protein